MSTFSLESSECPPDDLVAELTPPPVPEGLATYVDELLKHPARVRAALESRTDLAARTRAYVQVLVACTAAFGATLGFYRGGAQILFAAVKLPLVALLTLAVAAPLLHSLNRALARPANMAQDVSVLVAALARGALVLAAELPLVWAAHALGADYHRLIILTVLTCSIAGVVSLAFLLSALSATRSGRALVALVICTTMGVVGAHGSWLFRPFLVRPRATHVVFMHPLEGSFSDALEESFDSARGRYHDAEAKTDGLYR
jgi:hypothetical protein